MPRSTPFRALGRSAGLLLLLPGTAAAQQANPFAELGLRSIGPAVMGGRIHDVQSLADDPSTIWVASATGGLWKSTNRGTTWAPVFDGQPTGTFGVVAIAPSDHDVVWAGTGEQNNRQSSSWGERGLPQHRRRAQAGRTWDWRTPGPSAAFWWIPPTRTSPSWAPSAISGHRRRIEACSAPPTVGAPGSKVLFVDTLTGVVDMARDGDDPNTMYAAAYQRLRQPWGYNGGGPGSGIFRSTDGGRTWQRLSRGLPPGDKGRIGLATSAHTRGWSTRWWSTPPRGVSTGRTDGGEHWQRMSDMNSRPAYYSGLYVDPTNDTRLYLLTRWFYSSEDAGATWRTMPTEPTYDVGLKGDYHAMWIDPNDSRHFYLAGTAGCTRRGIGGRPTCPTTTSPSASSTASAWTTARRTGSTAACRTTTPGRCRAQPATTWASRARTGARSASTTASSTTSTWTGRATCTATPSGATSRSWTPSRAIVATSPPWPAPASRRCAGSG